MDPTDTEYIKLLTADYFV